MHDIADAIQGAGLDFTSIRVILVVLNIGASLSVLEVLVLNLSKGNHLE